MKFLISLRDMGVSEYRGMGSGPLVHDLATLDGGIL